MGWSTLVSVWVLWMGMCNPDRRIVLISKGEREAISLLGKSKLAHRSLPKWMKDRGPDTTDNNAMRLSFENGSVIESLPAAGDPGRGESVDLVVVDEYAFLPDPETAFAAIEPITDIGGRIIALSTANGSGNLFHSQWMAAETGNSNFVPTFVSWRAVPERDDAWYENKRRSYVGREHLLHQEYPTNPSDAFAKSGANVFDLDVLAKMVPEQPEARYSWAGDAFVPDPHGELQVWEHPQYDSKDRGHSYVIGADIARGLGHGDASVAWVLRADTQDAVAVWHGRVEPDIFGEGILKALGTMYHMALVAPENNGFGLATVKALQRTGYQRIFRSRSVKHRTEQRIETLGWSTTNTSKPEMISDLAAWLRDHNVPDVATIAELSTYVRDDAGRMSGSPHDDRVMALGIAVRMCRYAYAREYAPEGPVVANTFDWYMAEKRKADGTARKHMVLGGRVA